MLVDANTGVVLVRTSRVPYGHAAIAPEIALRIEVWLGAAPKQKRSAAK
jgi:hypothetical protein